MTKFFINIIVFICSIFNEKIIKQIITNLYKILADRYSDEKPKDKFNEKHPNYKKFYVDPLAPKLKKKNQNTIT
jgi:hypothetical protein